MRSDLQQKKSIYLINYCSNKFSHNPVIMRIIEDGTTTTTVVHTLHCLTNEGGVLKQLPTIKKIMERCGWTSKLERRE